MVLFGWIGDNIGRRETVIITTLMMAFSCFVVTILPTYAQIGVTASWILTICRVIQGITSMGERIGAELYLTETIKPPIQYPVVASVSAFGTIGTTFALGVASLVTLYGVNWCYAFGFGMVIAVIGSVARTTLRETPDFADAKRRIKKTLEEAQEDVNILNNNPIVQEKINKKTVIALTLLHCSWPAWLYFSYIHCGSILRNSFNYTAAEVIHQNFAISIIELFSCIVLTYLSYKIYPLKILKVLVTTVSVFILFCPYFLYNLHNAFELFLIQSFCIALDPSVMTATPIFFKHLPVFKRFTYGSLAYALARMIMSIITAFGMVYLTEYFGHWGLLIVMIPTCIGYAFGLRHFIKLEKQAGCYAHN
ncbi:MAG: MFS transporter [Candidatus Tisiphia sp.]|nr:MFS transporter [Candidatus Tisiphia sp.]